MCNWLMFLFQRCIHCFLLSIFHRFAYFVFLLFSSFLTAPSIFLSVYPLISPMFCTLTGTLSKGWPGRTIPQLSLFGHSSLQYITPRLPALSLSLQYSFLLSIHITLWSLLHSLFHYFTFHHFTLSPYPQTPHYRVESFLPDPSSYGHYFFFMLLYRYVLGWASIYFNPLSLVLNFCNHVTGKAFNFILQFSFYNHFNEMI